MKPDRKSCDIEIHNSTDDAVSSKAPQSYEHRKLAADPGARTTPDDVFQYANVNSWRDRVWNMLGDLITEEVKVDFQRNHPAYITSDDLSWLDDIIFEVTGVLSNIKTTAADRLSVEFTAFRAAHATRTDDLGQFYDQGLRILSNREIEDRAQALFLNGQYPRLGERQLEAAILDLNAGHFQYRDDQSTRLYLCADERDFITRSGNSGHYLDFGSEYLFNLAIRLVGEYEAKRALRSTGAPTILVFDIPMAMLCPATLEEFSGSVLEYLFCELVEDLEAHALGQGAGSALSLTRDLPPETLIGHYHPARFYHSHQR